MDAHYTVLCPHCETKNRVPEKRLLERPTCGRCHQPLLASGRVEWRVLEATDDSFRRGVIEARSPVLVEFYSPHCGYCLRMDPVLQKLAKELAGRVGVAKLDVEKNPITARAYSIEGTPTFFLFHGGEVKDRIVGAVSLEELKGRLML